MGSGISMATRKEITKNEAVGYAKASKKVKGEILDRLVIQFGWSRANARRQLGNAFKRKGPSTQKARKPRPPTYGYDTIKVLIRVWNNLGQPCGKYLAAVMEPSLDNMEIFHSFGLEARRYTPAVRTQLLAISPATIDRLLKPTRTTMDPLGKSSTRSRKTRLSELIPIMTHVPVLDEQPGLISVDTVAHCGHTLNSEYAYTLTATDVFTGWTVNRAIKNKASKWIIDALNEVSNQFPYPIDHIHSDNGSEFLNEGVYQWSKHHALVRSRSRPRHSNDNPWVEQKNGDIVRRSAFRYRYDTAHELELLNRLWPLVNMRKNLFLPTRKAVGHRRTRSGRYVRDYDDPWTPAQRVTDTGILLPPQREHLALLYDTVDVTDLSRIPMPSTAEPWSPKPH
jgi:transposase InsO family protein